MKKNFFSIIIVTYNNVDYTRTCLESVKRYSKKDSCEIIVVDNCSTDDTKEFLEGFAADNVNVKLIFNEKNLGYSAGNNKGLRAAQGEYLVLLNNDTVVTEGWLFLLKSKMDEFGCDMIGPVSNSVANRQKVVVEYDDVKKMHNWACEYVKKNITHCEPIDMLGFFCVVIKKNVFDSIGLLDENFGIGGFEDDDFCFRAKKAGFKLCYTKSSFVHHYGSMSFDKMGNSERKILFDKNKKYYERKNNTSWLSGMNDEDVRNRVSLEMCKKDLEKYKEKISDENKKVQELMEENHSLKKEVFYMKSSKFWKLRQKYIGFNLYLFLKKYLRKLLFLKNISHKNLTEKTYDKNIQKNKKIGKTAGFDVVDIVNINFYDWDGNEVYRGGAERYVYDLAVILKKMGYKPRLIQNANKYFEKVFKGFQVIGLPSQCDWDFRKFFDYYLNNFEGSKNIICSPVDIANIASDKNIIGINHGIHWDHFGNKLENFNVDQYRVLFDSLRNVRQCICVDTNFVNWVRTYDRDLSEKLTYLPNYYDENQFQYNEKEFSDERIVITYPRRLYKQRGFYLVSDIIDEVIGQYPNVEFHFVGQANKEEKPIIENLVKMYPGSVKWYHVDMSEMATVYKESQIILIPTVASEGTSLSCIEAMATNNAIISTDIGGLSNLIFNNYNGLLIKPDSNDLKTAIEKLIIDRSLRIRLAKNAVNVSKIFNKSDWDQKWIEQIKKNFNF